MSLLRGLVIAAATSALFGCASPPSSASEGGSVPGSAVEAPIFSAEPCDKDDDCAPVAECHPARCTRVEVDRMPSDMVCTTECQPGTVDCGYNHCGCAPSPSGPKMCALLPGPPAR